MPVQSVAIAGVLTLGLMTSIAAWAQSAAAAAGQLDEVVISSQRLGLIGTATTSSQGVVADDELALTPALRPGQVLETVPGLVVTIHSGEGKANQYLLRGFNLDHGTDLAVTVDGMPINAATHAHGQGYTDLNFMIPELATGLQYTKGPYFADKGDFASVGSVSMSYLDHIDDQIALSAGDFGFRRLFAAGSVGAVDGNLLGALELQHYDGPWVTPDDQRKVNGVVRYSHGDEDRGYSLTAMFYHDSWNATTDQPERAIDSGLISRFGSLDPTDGGQTQRASFSYQTHMPVADGMLAANAYYVRSSLTLWNDFTHYLDDPVNGDQEAQHEDRNTLGGTLGFTRTGHWLDLDHDLGVGASVRTDAIDVSRLPTRGRQILPASADPLSFTESDQVHETSLGVYAQATTHWSSWFRSVLGVRADYARESDSGTNYGSAHASLLQPKGSLILTPVDTTELYLSAGRGFHTNDARGVDLAEQVGDTSARLMGATTGEEVGLRQQFGRRVALTLTFFQMDFRSETTYSPDVGQDSAGPPSRRRGVELNVTYQARRWLEFYTSLAATHARFTEPFDDGTGHMGEYIPDAPDLIGSFAAYVKGLGLWSGGLEYRYLGNHSLTPDNAMRGSGYGEWNGNVRYGFSSGWSVGLGLYNLLNQHANAAEYWYVDRLAGESVDGVADLHIHPLEPFTARFTVGRTF
jgi:outer membrane receptor protein involved in Fe transport